MRRRLRDLVPISASALALWGWAHRDEVAEWGAFAVRAAQSVVRGNRSDPVVELRLRAAFLEDQRTRRASGLSLRVREGVAILTGLVRPEVRDVAAYLAERTEGIAGVDDRLELLPER